MASQACCVLRCCFLSHTYLPLGRIAYCCCRFYELTTLCGFLPCCAVLCPVLCWPVLCSALCRAVLLHRRRVVLSLHTSTVLCQSRQPAAIDSDCSRGQHTHTHTLCTLHSAHPINLSQHLRRQQQQAGGVGWKSAEKKKSAAALLLALGKMKFKSLAKFLLLIKWKRAGKRGRGRGVRGLPRALIWLWWLLWSRRFSSHKFNQHQI